jgi:hypothetical protein
MKHALLIASIALAPLASSCANLGGVDSAAPPARRLATAFTGASATDTARAGVVRADYRRQEVIDILADDPITVRNQRQPTQEEAALLRGQFAEALCAGYAALAGIRERAGQSGAAGNGLTTLIADSPITIAGLRAQLAQGTTFPGAESEAARRAREERSARARQLDTLRAETVAAQDIAAACARDANDENILFTTPHADGGRTEGALSAVLGAVNVFKTLVAPVIRNAMTRADRTRRLEALRIWALRPDPDATVDGVQPHDLPYLLNEMQTAEDGARREATFRRRAALGAAYRAWNELRDARSTAGAACRLQADNWEDTCVARIRQAVGNKLDAFLTAAAAYDTAFDADPARSFRATRLAGIELQNWFDGDMSAQDAAVAEAAGWAAAQSWLETLAAAEAWYDDDATRKKFSDAAEALREALD